MKPNPSRRVALWTAFVTLLAGSLFATSTVTTAQAADGPRINARPERVHVNQSYENVRWSVRNRNGCYSDADATLEHVGRRSTADYDYDSRPGDGLSGRLRLYDFERMGKYVVYGEGWNDCIGEFGDAVSFRTDYIMVKRTARIALDGNRHHRRKVTLRAKVRKYNGGYPVWRNHRNARVIFQRKTARGWTRIRRDDTNRRGAAKVTVRRAKRARYRAVVRPTATVWGRTSSAIRR